MIGQTLMEFLALVLVPPALLFVALNLKKTKRRTYDTATITQFEPPEGLAPAELLFFTGMSFTHPGVGTLVDLAERGHLSIEDLPLEERIRLPQRHGNQRMRRWRVVPHQGRDALRPFEQDMIERVQSKGEGFLEVDPQFVMGKKTSMLLDGIPMDAALNHEMMMQGLREKDYFLSGGILTNRRYLPWLGIWTLAIAGGWSLFNGAPAIGLSMLLSASVLMSKVGRWAMLTEKGHAVVPRALGFRRYVKSVYAHRVDWTMHEDADEKLLGYAVAFGCGDRWHETLARPRKASDGRT